MMPMIVGLTGLAASGKTTATEALCVAKPNFVRLKFAGPLKDMLAVLGLTRAHLEGELKNEPLDILCGKTPRYAMQTLGTEWGRNTLGDNIWVRVLQEKARGLMLRGYSVVVDDVRFPNEVEGVKRMGGIVVRVTRPLSVIGMVHDSERHVLQLPVDHEIHNDGTAEELGQQLIDYLKGAM